MSEVLQAPELASPEKVAESTAMVNDANSLHALAVFVIHAVFFIRDTII